MRHMPNFDFKWILLCVDYWCKFNFAYPIKDKQVVSVSEVHLFGIPNILHSDNGREFINHLIEELLQSCHSYTQLISGCPQHRSGAVKRSHCTLERKLAVKISENASKSPTVSVQKHALGIKRFSKALLCPNRGRQIIKWEYTRKKPPKLSTPHRMI